jgi:hypothetical protein
MPVGAKLGQVLWLSKTVLGLASLRVRRGYPDAGEREAFLRTPALHVPRELMIRTYGWHPDLGTTPQP